MDNNFLPSQQDHNAYQEQPAHGTDLADNNVAGQQLAPPPSTPSGRTNQASPIPHRPSQPGPQGSLPPQQQTWRGQNFLAQPAQMVRRISNKVAAIRRQGPPVEANPMVRYRAPQQSLPASPRAITPVPARAEPWRRSRAQRITRIARKRRARSYEHGPNRKRLSTILISVITGLLAVLIATGGISSYAYYTSQVPKLQGLANLNVRQSTHIYDRNGNLLYTLFDGVYGRSTPVSYNEIPGVIQDAQIAAEDKTFWTNSGVDPQAILRSAFQDTSSQQIQSGASTITQQVVRNLDHQTQQAFQRKLSEAALAIGLTQQYPKWKILEMYFNIAPFGTQEQGIEAAAQDFFGLKSVCDANFKCTPAVAFLDRDLSKCKVTTPQIDETTCAVDPILGLARASLLASIPQNPPTYDPLANANDTALLQRQDYVLKQMLNDQMSINLGLGSQTQNTETITPAIIQQTEALSKNIQFAGFQGGKKAPYFVDWVIGTLANALGNGDYNTGLGILEDSGLNIRTTLDMNLETYVENAVHRHLDEPEYQKFQGITVILSQHNTIHDSATVVMNAKTGEVLAMDGSAGDPSSAGARNINMATQPRQPGSSFKPITLAAAYEMGWYPGIVVPDNKTYFPKSDPGNLPVTDSAAPLYIPTDYGSGYSGKKTNIAESIATSYNIPAVKTLMYAGVQNVYNMAQRLGITSIDPKKTTLGDSMALGTYEVPLLQMVDAYQTFANYGTRIPPHGILDVWDNYGHDLYHYDPTHPNGTPVLSPQISFMVTSTIDNETLRYPEFLNDHDLSMWDWTLPDGTHPDVAAKTGTTQDFKDNLTIGYTPDIVVGVWAGNANDIPMTNSIGITGAAPIWHSVIEYASGHCETSIDNIPCPPNDLNLTDRHFSVPQNVIQQQVNHTNGLAGSGYTSYMLPGEQPQQGGGLGDSSKPQKPRKGH